LSAAFATHQLRRAHANSRGHHANGRRPFSRRHPTPGRSWTKSRGSKSIVTARNRTDRSSFSNRPLQTRGPSSQRVRWTGPVSIRGDRGAAGSSGSFFPTGTARCPLSRAAWGQARIPLARWGVPFTGHGRSGRSAPGQWALRRAGHADRYEEDLRRNSRWRASERTSRWSASREESNRARPGW